MRKAERLIALATLLIMLVTAFAGCTKVEEGESDWTPIYGDPSLKPDTGATEEQLCGFGTYPSTLAGKEIVNILNQIKIDDITGLWTEYEGDKKDKDGNVTSVSHGGYNIQTGYYYYGEGPTKSDIAYKYYAKQDKNYFLVQQIQWIILEDCGDSYVMIAREAIDSGRPFLDDYQQSAWANSTMRDWLNGTGDYAIGGEKYVETWNFFDRAFDDTQKNAIVPVSHSTPANATYGTPGGDDTTDKVYFLSSEEAAQYFTGNLRMGTSATVYAYYRGAQAMYDNRSAIWWLRTPGISTFFLGVDRSGTIGEGGYDSNDATIGIRPVIKVLKSAVEEIDKTAPTAGSIATPTPKPKSTPTEKPE